VIRSEYLDLPGIAASLLARHKVRVADSCLLGAGWRVGFTTLEIELRPFRVR
jgi:hypothetical protein